MRLYGEHLRNSMMIFFEDNRALRFGLHFARLNLFLEESRWQQPVLNALPEASRRRCGA